MSLNAVYVRIAAAAEAIQLSASATYEQLSLSAAYVKLAVIDPIYGFFLQQDYCDPTYFAQDYVEYKYIG